MTRKFVVEEDLPHVRSGAVCEPDVTTSDLSQIRRA